LFCCGLNGAEGKQSSFVIDTEDQVLTFSLAFAKAFSSMPTLRPNNLNHPNTAFGPTSPKLDSFCVRADPLARLPQWMYLDKFTFDTSGEGLFTYAVEIAPDQVVLSILHPPSSILHPPSSILHPPSSTLNPQS
jgi:hypothetical protein